MIYNVIGEYSRRFLTRFIIVIMLGITSLPGASLAKDDVDIVTVQPALWVVEKIGSGEKRGSAKKGSSTEMGERKLFLFGSFHLLPKNYRWYEGIIQQSFEDSDELIMETNLDPKAMTEIQGIVLENAFFHDGDDLKNHLDADHYQKMLGYAKKLMGTEEAMARAAKPWFMAIQLSVLSIMSSGLDPDSGVDNYLKVMAEKRKIPIMGMETPAGQMRALIDHPLDVQSAMLADTLDKLDDFEDYIASYLEAWASGDGDEISKTMIDDMAKHPEIYQALLLDRNKKWLPIIEGYIARKKSTFIVVGAAHLVGPDGIVKMLRDKGYKVEKIQ